MESKALTWRSAMLWTALMLAGSATFAQVPNPFLPITTEWATPNESHLASGAPGPAYWQQRADYRLSVTLDDVRQRLSGEGTVTYHNPSPHTLHYLWVQLDQNLRKPDAMVRQLIEGRSYSSPQQYERHFAPEPTFLGGMEELSFSLDGTPLHFSVVMTNARIDLPQPMRPGDSLKLQMKWAFAINDARAIEGRSGYEFFPEDGNYLYEIAQFYPRMCLYDAMHGWENTPFYGPAEFGLEFGDFDLEINVPEDHVVAATGTLLNPEAVLSKVQRQRLSALQMAQPQFIIKPEEAIANQKSRAKGRKAWHFEAHNVRDFAFASSRKFIWDAAKLHLGEKDVVVQSLYPKEGMPLWDKYATHAIIHTLQTYSQLTFDFPYPTATAIHGPVWGMEYPMIAFCGGRPTSSGYYTRQSKYLMIGVVMHEVGHNYFPMIVNSDERRWAWMDEGLNSFCQIIAEKTWERGFPLRRGDAEHIADLMRSSDHQPIMTNPESLRDLAVVSYEKAAIGLLILRQEVMGPEAFDMAFREYARRWAFKHPEPEDFFRTLEDASGHALSWFWRTWFYEANSVNMGIASVKHFVLSKERMPKGYIDPHRLPHAATKTETYYIDGKPELRDRYEAMEGASGEANDILLQDILKQPRTRIDTASGYHVYQVQLDRDKGGILPVQLMAIYADGARERFRIPAEVWMQGNDRFLKEVYSDKPILAFILDPEHLIPDIDRNNDVCPRANGKQPFESADLRK